MTVKQLIAALLAQDFDLPVALEDADGRVVLARGELRIGLTADDAPTRPGDESPGPRILIVR